MYSHLPNARINWKIILKKISPIAKAPDFPKQPLGEIMRTLERWYDIHVVFADSVAGKLRFSGRLKRYEDIDNLLTMIKLTNDVDFEIAERVIIVRTNKNRK